MRIRSLLTLPPGPLARGRLLPLLFAFGLSLPLGAALMGLGEPPGSLEVPADRVAQVDDLARKAGVDPELLRAMAWAESRFNPEAKSPAGAMGILQVMPETARKHGAADVDNPQQVAEAGAKYLRFLLDRYQGDVAKAVAAYNGGETALESGQLTEETLRYQAQVLDLVKQKAVRPMPAPEGARVAYVARRENRLTLRMNLTREELSRLLLAEGEWLWAVEGPDRQLQRVFPPLLGRGGATLTLDMKGVTPEELQKRLKEQGFLPKKARK